MGVLRKGMQKTSETKFPLTFLFVAPTEEVQQLGVRLRLYGCERMRREKMLGEVIVPFASINLTLGNTFWLTLEPRANLAVSSYLYLDLL